MIVCNLIILPSRSTIGTTDISSQNHVHSNCFTLFALLLSRFSLSLFNNTPFPFV